MIDWPLTTGKLHRWAIADFNFEGGQGVGFKQVRPELGRSTNRDCRLRAENRPVPSRHRGDVVSMDEQLAEQEGRSPGARDGCTAVEGIGAIKIDLGVNALYHQAHVSAEAFGEAR